MMLQTFLMFALGAQALLPGGFRDAGQASSPPEQTADALQVRYEADTRQVTNWRREAVSALEPTLLVAAAAWLNAERPVVTRCVKLNNYWCIKSARWNGELATDAEGHVGFASADHGADAAAALLRRYYVDYNRKSALDIVRRWAPAECNVATGIGGIAMLAVRGIGGTVRAQYLASRRKKGGAVRYTAKAGPRGKPGRVSLVIPMAPKAPQYRVPSIAEGLGEKPRRQRPQGTQRRNPVNDATRAAPAAAAPKSQATAACPSEEQRHRNYADRMSQGLGLKPTDDLKLFSEDGAPLPNLLHVMLAMSAFELGVLRASPNFVEEAVARASLRERNREKAGGGAATLTRAPAENVER